MFTWLRLLLKDFHISGFATVYLRMELKMTKEEMFPVGKWGLDLLGDHSGGLFGDLKLQGCSDSQLGNELQVAVEHELYEPSFQDEDILGLEWMESSDLGSILGSLDSNQDCFIPLEIGLSHHTSSATPEDIAFEVPSVQNEPTCEKKSSLFESNRNQSSNNYSRKENDMGGSASEIFDALLSTPGSPEQMEQIFQEERDRNSKQELREPEPWSWVTIGPTKALSTGESFESTLSNDDLFWGDLTLISADTSGKSLIKFDDAGEIIDSPLSADDVESMLSTSSPPSPSSTNQSSIIDSSPELYKVITTSSVEGCKRYSPYSTPKICKQVSNSSKMKASTSIEPVEHLNKKERKKLQNKNAAIRYRMKKKEEAVGIKSEEQQLEEINGTLKMKVEDLQREIKYMKNLMEDVCKAKGLL